MENTKYKEEIENALMKVRPFMQADGGDVEFVRFDESTGTLFVKLVGACAHCSFAQVTLKMGIEEEIKKVLPFVKKVETP